MSQSSVDEQVKELETAGMPVRRGVRMTVDPNQMKNDAQFGSDLWLSRWARNAFRNYPIVSKAAGARFLHDACKGMPAFVVGVAPSLDSQIQDLKLAQKRAVIVSTDAAFRALLANGITPDIVVSYDCKDNQNRLWADMPLATHSIPMLFNSCTNPKSIETWGGPIMFFNQYHEQDDLCKKILPTVFPEIGQIPSAGTVGTMALMAASLMGCEPICLVGMDFCFQAEGSGAWRYRAQDYSWATNIAAGVPDGWTKTIIKELYDNDERVARSFVVKGEDGKEFRTDPELVYYLESFKNLTGAFKIPVVNCSPDGMIPSSVLQVKEDAPHEQPIEKMSVADAVKEFCKKEFQGGRCVLPNLGKIIPDPRRNMEAR